MFNSLCAVKVFVYVMQLASSSIHLPRLIAFPRVTSARRLYGSENTDALAGLRLLHSVNWGLPLYNGFRLPINHTPQGIIHQITKLIQVCPISIC
jgi:hypothetical protein